jgi:putative transcriptional regulator
MKPTAGTILKSTDALDGSIFEGALILITSYDPGTGAVGFVINRPFSRPLNALQEFSHVPYFPLFEGGPVDQEHLFFIHRRPDLIAEGIPAGRGLYSGGNFNEAVAAIVDGRITEKELKIFVGYCGWDGGELETEIAEGSWTVSDESDDRVFG